MSVTAKVQNNEIKSSEPMLAVPGCRERLSVPNPAPVASAL